MIYLISNRALQPDFNPETTEYALNNTCVLLHLKQQFFNNLKVLSYVTAVSLYLRLAALRINPSVSYFATESCILRWHFQPGSAITN